MRRHLLLSLTIALAVLHSCSAVAPGTDGALAPTHSAIDAEEYAVYSGLIKAMYIGGTVSRIAILDETCAFLNGTNTTSGDFQQIASNLSGLEWDTMEDFRAKNAEPKRLEERFDLKYTDYVLISKDEVIEIFGNGGGWDVFYRRYPDSQGVMTLSRVGFNENTTQAFVYVGNQMHWTSGAGYYAVLSKEGKRWAVKQQLTAWVT